MTAFAGYGYCGKDEKDIVAEQAMPADWSPAERRQKDVEARWTKKHGKSYFGYKLQAGLFKSSYFL